MQNDSTFHGVAVLHDPLSGCDPDASINGCPQIGGGGGEGLCTRHTIRHLQTVWLHSFSYTLWERDRLHLHLVEVHV